MSSSEFGFDELAAEMRFEFLANGLGRLAAAETDKVEAGIDAAVANSLLTDGVTIDDQLSALDHFVDAQSRIHDATIRVRSAWSALHGNY